MTISFKRRVSFVMCLLILGVHLVEAKESSANGVLGGREGVSALCPWTPDDQQLVATLRKERDSGAAVLEVYRVPVGKGKPIGRFKLDSFPYSMTPFGGQLIAICQTATGYLVYAFTYRNGSIVKIVDDGSNLQPELIYFGSSIEAAISVPILEWQGGNRIPTTANVYMLQGENVGKPKRLPWKERFGEP